MRIVLAVLALPVVVTAGIIAFCLIKLQLMEIPRGAMVPEIPTSRFFRLCDGDCRTPALHNAHLTWFGHLYFALPSWVQSRAKRFLER